MSKKSRASQIEVAEEVIKPIPGMIPVTSTNIHGFAITTAHIYERGAAWEREQRVKRGEVLRGESCI